MATAVGVRTFQAEDEISGIGAAFGGALGVTTTSGPGVALKSETIGLAVSLEPLLIIDVQRGGPSTGLPTKTEQADLLQAMYGRNGDAPVPVAARAAPGNCFDAAMEAARIALTYRTRSLCSPTAPSPMAPSPGVYRTSTNCRTCGYGSPPPQPRR
jgi:2-oxoglutarate ferredoxin oxidoreductase subunit alpha